MTNKNLNLNALEQYVSPGMKTLSLQSEGVLCGSTFGKPGEAGMDGFYNEIDGDL